MEELKNTPTSILMVVTAAVEAKILSEIADENHKVTLATIFSQREQMDIDEFLTITNALIYHLSDDQPLKSYLREYIPLLTSYVSAFINWSGLEPTESTSD